MTDFEMVGRLIGVAIALAGFGFIITGVITSFNWLFIIGGAVAFVIGIVIAIVFQE